MKNNAVLKYLCWEPHCPFFVFFSKCSWTALEPNYNKLFQIFVLYILIVLIIFVLHYIKHINRYSHRCSRLIKVCLRIFTFQLSAGHRFSKSNMKYSQKQNKKRGKYEIQQPKQNLDRVPWIHLNLQAADHWWNSCWACIHIYKYIYAYSYLRGSDEWFVLFM